MKNGQKGSATVILLVVLIVVLATVLVYFIFLKKPDEVAVNPTPTKTATATPTPPQPSVPAGWTTYKNSVNSFTFNYPANWYLGSDPSNAVILRSLPSSSGLGQGLLGQGELGVEIAKTASNNVQSLKTWCENNIANFQFSHQTVQFSNGHYVTIGGSDAYSVDYQVKEDSRLNGRQICVANGNDKFNLVAYPLNSSLLSDFDEITASFKFTK